MHHLDGAPGALAALVAKIAAGAVDGLLLVVDGEDTEDDGDVAVGVEGRHALRDTLADIVKVGRVAAYHAAKDDDGIEQTRLYQLRGGKGEFDGPGDMEDADVLVEVEAGLAKDAQGVGGHGLGDVAVPLGGDNCHAHIGYYGQLESDGALVERC